MVGSVTVTPKGKEFDVEWTIEDIISREERASVYCISPPISIQDRSWNLLLYPNGSIYNDSVGYIFLCLHREALFSAPIDAEFSIGLKTVNGEKDLELHCTEFFKVSESYRIYQFISRSDFLRRKSEFVASGFLTIICKFKRFNIVEDASNIVRAKCLYSKKSSDIQEIFSHQKKCPECSEVILLRKCQKATAEAATNTPELSVIHPHNKILQDFKQLFLKPDHCDAVIRVKDREFSAHKAILAARSPVFASAFRNEMKEKKTGIVDIEDCDPSAFPDFLCFLYSGEVLCLSQENAFDLFALADRYDVSDLRAKCLEFLKENISVETFCETLTLGLQHVENELITIATDFFIKNAEKILVTVKWQSFAVENPIQSNEMVIKFATSYRCSKS